MWYFWWIIVVTLVPTIFETCKDNEEILDGFIIIMVVWLVLHIIASITTKINQKINDYQNNRMPNDNKLDKLEKLSILRWQGALTDNEFEEMKEKILKK